MIKFQQYAFEICPPLNSTNNILISDMNCNCLLIRRIKIV